MNRYFQEQLRMLREGAKEFARKYPAAAPMLLEQGGDPDAERILEGTAFLCAKIHERLDQTAPVLIQTLLREVFPESVTPVPSMAVVRFALKPGFSEPLTVKRGTQLASRSIGGVSCLYSTVRDFSILPLSIASVESSRRSDMSADAVLTLRSATPLLRFLPDSLNLHLAGSYSLASQRLFSLLTRLESITISSGASSVELPPSALSISRMPLEDMRLPESRIRNRAYSALIHYFCSPELLTSFDIMGLKKLRLSADARELKITFRFSGGVTELPQFADGDFALNTVAVSNIFHVHSEPIEADLTREEYKISPHVREKEYVDIIGVSNVTAIGRGGHLERCRPYGLYNAADGAPVYNVRYAMPEKGERPEHYISMPRRPGAGGFESCILSMDLICCNIGLPNRLLQGDICMPTDSSPSQATFENLTAPSATLPPPADERLQWRFLAHMNANILPIASPEALRQVLSLYAPQNTDAPELAVACAKKRQSVRAFSAADEELLFSGRIFRGRRLSLEVDPTGFVSLGDLWLFADALDRFLAEFAPINSYTRLVVRVLGTDEKWQWPPRLGNRLLI